MELKPLTKQEFEERLLKNRKEIFSTKWLNYPNSLFYYDIPDFDGTTDPIGVYTGKTAYSITEVS